MRFFSVNSEENRDEKYCQMFTSPKAKPVLTPPFNRHLEKPHSLEYQPIIINRFKLIFSVFFGFSRCPKEYFITYEKKC